MSAEAPDTEAVEAEEQDVAADDGKHHGPVPPAKDADREPARADDDETIVKPYNNYNP